MKVKVATLDLRFDMGKTVKLIRANTKENIKFEGMTGTVTNPFGEFELTDVGLMLDVPKCNCDTVNLHAEDVVEVLD